MLSNFNSCVVPTAVMLYAADAINWSPENVSMLDKSKAAYRVRGAAVWVSLCECKYNPDP